jgi:drug/metabolite transporter (DMT)-like permease
MHADDGARAETRATRNLALLAVATAVAAWGSSSVLIKLTSTTGFVTSFYRLWFAIPLLWLIAMSVPGMRPRISGPWCKACLLGGSLFAIHQIFFFNSLKMTSVANVTIIGAVQPALVLLLAGRLFGERVTSRGLLWATVAFVGTALVMVGSAGMPNWSPLGDALAVANLLAFTAYFLASKRVRATIAAFEYVVGMTTVAGVVLLLFCLASGQNLRAPVGRDWLIFVFLAAVPGTLGHFLTNWAHEHTPAFVMSIMFLAVPVLASAAAAFFLGELLRPAHLFGGTIVLVSIGIVVRTMRDEAGIELAEGAAQTDAP